MKTIKKEIILDIAERFIVNLKSKNGELDVILGHNKHILGHYTRDHVKLIGGWYYKDIGINVKFLSAIIEKYQIIDINFIGASKSCSGCIILAKELLKYKFPELKMKLFLFSAYTTIDRNVYIKRKIEDKAPNSLRTLWHSEYYTESLIKKMEARRLVNIKNIDIYLFYPTKSKQGEIKLARRIEGNNINYIELPVYMHNTLFPFWKKVQNDMTIELYENEFRKMHRHDYAFYTAMQMYQEYKFHLYSCIKEPHIFMAEFDKFKISYMKDSK